MRIKSGKHAGVVGTVEAVAEKSARVRIEGVMDGEPVNVAPWIALAALEAVRG